MAIQIPNPGTGNGATGDNEFVLWSKVKDNFANTDHAASRLVGLEKENVVTAGNSFKASSTTVSRTGALQSSSDDLNNLTDAGAKVYVTGAVQNAPSSANASVEVSAIWGAVLRQTWVSETTTPINMFMRIMQVDGTWTPWVKFYTSANTTTEDGTNYLKVASPILRLQHDDFIKEHEAEKMDIVVDNPSVGIYKISGTTGLRNDGTWYFSPPKDEHNNVLCMVEVSEENDIITVNTYKKKFDFETVSIVPDYEQPTDIPSGATVMLRFNELPQEPLPEV